MGNDTDDRSLVPARDQSGGPLAPAQEQPIIQVQLGTPLGDDAFGKLESALLARDTGQFLVVDAPGGAAGKAPYRIPEEGYYGIGFNASNDIHLVIPKAGVELAEEDARFYDWLRRSSEYDSYGGMMRGRRSGRLNIVNGASRTYAIHDFPTEFLPVSVNGGILKREERYNLGNVATFRIGNRIKIAYVDNR